MVKFSLLDCIRQIIRIHLQSNVSVKKFEDAKTLNDTIRFSNDSEII